jgi:hypothetical protein
MDGIIMLMIVLQEKTGAEENVQTGAGAACHCRFCRKTAEFAKRLDLTSSFSDNPHLVEVWCGAE